jgi:16S rRNA processing protein RimM
MPSGHVAVGRILAPHGLRGDMKVEPLTAQPEHFAVGATLWIGDSAYQVEASRGQKGFIFVRLAGVASVEEAEALRGCLLSLPEDDLAPLPEDEYYAYQLIGLDVFDVTGERLGKIVRLLATGSNDVYVVGGPYGELLVPAIGDVVVEVDMPGGRIVVSLMEGMLPGSDV